MHRRRHRTYEVVRVVVQRGDTDSREVGPRLFQRIAAQRRMAGGDASQEGLGRRVGP